MKKILSLLLSASLLFALSAPCAVYAAQSTVLEETYKFDFTKYDVGSSGDYTSASLGDGLIIRTEDSGDGKVSIENDAAGGKVLNFGPSITSYESGICIKRKPAVNSSPLISFKIKAWAKDNTQWVNPGCIDVFSSSSRVCRLWLRWGSSSSAAYPKYLYLRNESASGFGDQILIAQNFDGGTPGWLDITLKFDFKANTYDIEVGGEVKKAGEACFDQTADTDITEVYFHCAGNNGSFSVDDVKICKTVPTALSLTNPESGTENAEIPAKLTFTANKENLDVSGAELLITPENGTAVKIANAATNDPINKKMIHFDLKTAGFVAQYGVKYTVSVSKIKDKDGNDVQNQTAVFKTRTPKLVAEEPVFEKEGNIKKGTLCVKNEKNDESFETSVIFAAFDGNVLKDARIDKKTVDGGKTEEFSAALQYGDSYTYKAFVWNSLEKMNPVGNYENAQTLVQSEILYDFLSGVGKVSGSMKKNSRVTLLLQKSGKTLDEINADGCNLTDIIAYIGEAQCGEDGKYSADFALELSEEENGKKIKVLTGGSGISAPIEGEFFYYDKKTVKKILETFKDETAADKILKLLSGEETVDGVKINDILKLDMSLYNNLNDKRAVCAYLAGMTFEDAASVYTAFEAAVMRQKAIEEKSSFKEQYFDFEPKDGTIKSKWSVSQTSTYAKVGFETKEESLEDNKKNNFYRFSFGPVDKIPQGTIYTQREHRSLFAFDDVVSYNDTPKVISFKFRLEGEVVSSEMELLGSDPNDRSTKEIIFNMSGNKVYQNSVQTGIADADMWHTFEIVLDATGKLDKENNKKRKYFFIDGKEIKNEELSSGGSTAAKHISLHTTFPAGSDAKTSFFDFDDLKIEEYSASVLLKSNPKNGEKEAEITDKIELTFDKEISIAKKDDFSLYGGKNPKASSLSVSKDKKTLTFTLEESLDYDTAYKAVVSGLKDNFSEEVTPVILQFKTRERTLRPGEVSYKPSSSDTTDCTVEIKNENTDGVREATVIFAAFEENEMTDVYIVQKSIRAQESENFMANIKEKDTRKIKVFFLNSLSGMEPIGDMPSAEIATVKFFTDYKTGKGKISGTLLCEKEGAEAVILILKPQKTLNDTDPIAYIAQVKADKDGNYEKDFLLHLSTESTQNRHTADVWVNTKGAKNPQKKSFICYSDSDADKVLSAIKNAKNAEEVKSITDGKILEDNINTKELLHLDTDEKSVWSELFDKTTVCAKLVGKTFANVKELKDSFDTAVKEQKEYEDELKSAILKLNNATYEETENLWKSFRTLFKPNLLLESGLYYPQLGEEQKISLFKHFANEYTYVLGADINQDIEEFAKKLLSPTPPVIKDEPSGGNVGAGGSRGDNNVKMNVSENVLPAQSLFSDIGSVLWAQEGIEYLARKNIINGVGGNLFAPDDLLTREQMVKIMVLAASITPLSGNGNFDDVSDDEWFAPYVEAAVKSGIVAGIGGGKFGSGLNVTRGDLAVFLARLAKIMNKPLKTQEVTLYSDDAAIFDYAKEAVYTLRACGIMNGTGEGKFSPLENVSRAMAAKAVYEMLRYGE